MIKLNVDMYAPHSGKWKYGFSVWMKEPKGYIETKELLEGISLLQNAVQPSSLTSGNYTVVIKESEETMENPDYQNFLCRLVPAKV